MTYFLGIDFGTSGARAIAIDADHTIAQTITYSLAAQTPTAWQQTLFKLLDALQQDIAKHLRAIAINGTSGTVLLCDAAGKPRSEALLYNDDRGRSQLTQLADLAPTGHLVQSATSSLAKLLWFQAEGFTDHAQYFLHQADWLAGLLHGQWGISDYHNALKLGFDVEKCLYPAWLQSTSLFKLLPAVKTPGASIGKISGAIATQFQINPHCQIRAGTTDSIAAFMASGASKVGEAVTSLGSTLVVKLLSDRPVNDQAAGVYSHRFGQLWLTGGASNTGGAVLKHFFDEPAIRRLSDEINPHISTGLAYYPLLKPGDRFPINDPNLEPRLTPRPDGDRQFFQGLLEGITHIEAMGYDKLQELGAPKPTKIFTAGGGAQNPTWTTMRQKQFSCPVLISPNPEAAYGSARLAHHGNLNEWS
ncbi:FGGY-family carbohydrate kinase [[Limnothrix rosea] IAM M-220]|uniref:FGGY-family carbohydrate kinase n=1 Tax=[Limnothrix rosea] IAM M-220 TaxID=454133 RepID=UPI000962A53C|nr:FGGY-family carbohydrate kinase [[Limnothrix rosea] IAM M-220]OKH12355.1 carbohydrate kinase [[Limnothrix rosea] IAM M-220]